MLGAIIGDMIGSQFESNKPINRNINLFNLEEKMTDDSYLTLATMKVFQDNYPISLNENSLIKIKNELIKEYIRTWRNHKDCGFGKMFYLWCQRAINGDTNPYFSIGNGAAMRISPVGWACNSLKDVKTLAKTVSEITHNTVEATKAAEAVAVSIYFSRKGYSKNKIRQYVIDNYYKCIETYSFSELKNENLNSCLANDTVPLALYAFFYSNSYKETIINSLLLGVDCDTICSISTAIAEAYYSSNKLSKFEDTFLYLMIDPDTERKIRSFYKTINSNKFNKEI